MKKSNTKFNVQLSMLFYVLTMLAFPWSTSQAYIGGYIEKEVGSQEIHPGLVKLKAPDIAENGAVVPVSVGLLNTAPGIAILEVWLFQAKDQQLVAHYKAAPGVTLSQTGLRIKLAKTTDLVAVARLSDGRLVYGKKNVKVTIGGCGGGSGGGSYSGYSPRRGPTNYIKPGVHYQSTVSDNENYLPFENSGVYQASRTPLSTFSVDVDTGSYANIRRFIVTMGRLPVENAVRVEEMINYFDYDYVAPENRKTPFAVHTEVGPTPWNRHTRLIKIGLKGYEEKSSNLPPANLVFLLDVSGSMGSPDKLPLLIKSLRMLTKKMRKQDRIAIAVYAGASGVVLPVTAGDQHDKIIRALEQLDAGGSTNGGQGILLAYQLAEEGFIEGGINRVILATDGDFNVGITDHAALIKLIEKQREKGISLTTLGFGSGNYNDAIMEQLADKGNGNYAYIDNILEARKVLVEQMAGTLWTIAKDVKIQVEFNPAQVAEYRLIGYENRALKDEDFNNDKVDAGDIGAGHTVTALYEITLADSQYRQIPKLKYTKATASNSASNELATVKLRFKQPDGKTSRKVEHIVYRDKMKNALSETSDDYRFAVAVAGFGQWLRKNEKLPSIDLKVIRDLAQTARKEDSRGYRSEFVRMLDVASHL